MASSRAITRVFLRNFSVISFSRITFNRYYSRGLHRTPIKVYTDEEAKNLNSKPSILYHEEKPQPLSYKGGPKKVQAAHQKNFRSDYDDEANNSFNNKSSQTYQKEGRPPKKFSDSPQDDYQPKINKKFASKKVDDFTPPKLEPIVMKADGQTVSLNIFKDKVESERKLSSLMMIVKKPKDRRLHGKILLEGERLIADAMKAGVPLEALFFSKTELLEKLPLGRYPDAQLYQVSQAAIQLWSELTTSPGISAFFDISKIQDLESLRDTERIPLTLICDNVRDPGNMGSILRSAAAVGCKRLITTHECVDLWDSKVLRSAAGAHFRVNTLTDVEWDFLVPNYIPENAVILLADSGSPRPSHKGRRWSQEELAQQLIRAESSAAQSKTVDVLEDGTSIQRDSSYTNGDILRVYRHVPLPQSAYYDLKLESNTPIVLVIGGETHGLSNAAHKLAHELGGSKVHIPLENQVESLNAGVAFGVLAYEIRRQLLSNDFKIVNNRTSADGSF